MYIQIIVLSTCKCIGKPCQTQYILPEVREDNKFIDKEFILVVRMGFIACKVKGFGMWSFLFGFML